MAACIVFFEYLDHVESDKEQEAARFVQSFGSTEVLRSRINMAVLMNSQEMLDLKQTTYASHVAPMINDEMRFRDISLLIAFFDTLSICVEAGQCSKKTSCDYFFREEEAFIQNMRPALDALSQRNGERVDTHMLKFTRSFCAKNMEEYCRMVVSYRSVDCAALKPKAGSP